MALQKTEALLNKFNYNFERNNSTLIIKLDFALTIIIDFSNPDNIKITDRLVGWNFLTGLIEMSIKNAIIYNFVGILLAGFVFTYLDYSLDKPTLIFVFLVFLSWVLLFSIYYFAKSETLKQNLIRWNE